MRRLTRDEDTRVLYPKKLAKHAGVPMNFALNNQSHYDFGFADSSHDFHAVKFVDDYGYSSPGGCSNARLWAIGNEYGYTHVVHARTECDALSAATDGMRTIEPDEVHEAYNAYDKLLERMTSNGEKNTPQLRDFCNRWARFYFEVDTKDANYTGAWDRWELDESYRLQSNSTGTGIVNVGHYEHMTEIRWVQLQARRKGRVTACLS